MSIVVENLTKVYGSQNAVDRVSFEVSKGEILGFLGPNGAGKSTTMKMITCYLPPTGGKVLVNGLDVTLNERKVKKIIGYLPENNPLYLDHYVHEYLRFIGKVNNIYGRTLTDRVNEIITLCGLEKEQNKLIGSLSKGYRQRVGLAQALLHDPDVLVLDEPTTGLDPNQIAEVRKLIREISATKTVILSTHIMQEVKAICDRVVIINNGKIVANSTVKELQKSMRSAITIKVQVTGGLNESLLKEIEGIISVNRHENNVWTITSNVDIRPEITKVIATEKLDLLELSTVEQSLEDIFMKLTEVEE